MLLRAAFAKHSVGI